ncbi:MAG: hypothetical protein IPM98_09465 [Lewinellaceae bacterium]|nr:hypothetical protein [Lewinellaceae bacterium]
MERSNNIDDLLRERLHDAEVPPPAFVWPNVEHALRRRKRRFIVWFLAFGIAGGLAGAGLWFFGPQTKPAAVQPIAGKTNTTPPPTSPAPATPTQPAPLPDHTHTPEATESATTGNTVSAAYPQRSTPATRTKSAAFTAGRTAASEQLPALQPDVVLAVPTPSPVPDIVKKADAPEARTTGPDALPGISRRITALLPGQIAGLELPVRTHAMSPVKITAAKAKKAPKKCYDFNSNRQAWLVDAYVGPVWANKRLQSGNSEFQDYIHDRERTEKRDWGYNAGIRASYLFAGNFMLRTGLHYDYFVEQFEHYDPNFVRYNLTVTQKLINGQWVTVTDTLGIEYGTDYLKTYNRFALLDIPLQGALELRSGPSGISLNLGGSVNVLFHKRGSILTPDGKPAPFTPGEGQYDVFRTRLGMSLMGSIQWFYHVSPRTRVFAEPYYRHILEPVTRSGYPVEQSQGVGGIRFGVTRIFD